MMLESSDSRYPKTARQGWEGRFKGRENEEVESSSSVGSVTLNRFYNLHQRSERLDQGDTL